MNTVLFITSVVLGLLIAEARLSRRNERLLRARGATMPQGDAYLALLILYPSAFVLMGAEGLWRAAYHATLSLEGPSGLNLLPGWHLTIAPVDAGQALAGGPSWIASGVLLFAASKWLKYWAIRTLGERWTFRVFVVPGAPLVTTGPYRYVTHPNYIAVIGELVGTAMMVGASVCGPLMTGAFGVALWARVRFENQVLRSIADPIGEANERALPRG